MGHSELRQQKLKVNVIEAGEIKSVVGERVDFVIIGQILVIFVIHLQFKSTLLRKSLKSVLEFCLWDTQTLNSGVSPRSVPPWGGENNKDADHFPDKQKAETWHHSLFRICNTLQRWDKTKTYKAFVLVSE